MNIFLVALGAAIGAPLRYLTDRAIQRWHSSAFAWGTLTVNLVGSFILGFVVAVPANPALLALAATGFCGALTTYSTFSYEALRLTQTRAYGLAVTYVGVSVLAGLGMAYAGVALAGAVT